MSARPQLKSFPKAFPIVAGIFIAVMTPSAPMAPSEWAAENLVVPDGPRAGGRWDPALTPYVPPIIDAFAPEAETTFGVVRKSAQTGVTVAGIALVGSYIDTAPCRIGYALPTIDLLQEFNREKLSPALRQTRVLKEKVRPQTSRSSEGSTSTNKKFRGGSLSIINANSAPDLRSRTLRVGIADEIDAWADDVGDYGDPLDQFKDRFVSFHATGDWRLLALSTPGLKGVSRVDAQFLAGDQRYWTMDCPGCGAPFHFEFKHLKFNRRPPYAAHYEAPCCGTVIEHEEKALLVRSGRFVATNSEGLYPSWHIDALVSLLTTWDKIAEEFWASHGHERKEKRFWNNWLGLAYEMRGDAPDHERLMERREDYRQNIVPPRGLLLVAGADVQHSGIWVEVVAYGADRQSWSVSWRFLEGDTTDHKRGAWPKLAEVYDEVFEDSFGGQRSIEAMAVDAGDGGRANQVYAWCRSRSRAFAIKGQPGWTHPAIGAPSRVDINLRGRKIRRGATLWPVGTWSLKGEFYANLRKAGLAAGKEIDPPGYCHFSDWHDEGFFKQITSEYLADETFKGRTRKVWKQSNENNHLLDCRVYAMAMAEYLGLSRMTADKWRDLARLRGVPAELADPDLFAPDPVAIAAKAPAKSAPAAPGKGPKVTPAASRSRLSQINRGN